MAQFVGPLGSVQGWHDVRNVVIATTTVKLLSDSSNRALKIAEILPLHGGVQEEEEMQAQLVGWTPMYLVYAPRANSDL